MGTFSEDTKRRSTVKYHPAIGDLSAIVDKVIEHVQNLNATAGQNDLFSTAVPSGKIHIITNIACRNDSSTIYAIRININSGGYDYRVKGKLSPVPSETVSFSGFLYLTNGDKISGTFNSCSAGDNIYMDITGYEIDEY